MTLGTVTIGQARKDGRTIFSMSRLRSAGSAAQPRSSSCRTKAVTFLTGPSCLSRKRRSIQCQHLNLRRRFPTIAKTRAANIAASSATKGCKEGVASSQRWFQRVERK